MSGLDAHQRAIARLTLGAELDEASLASLGGDRVRWLVYRDLVRNRLWSLLLEALPRTFAAAGSARFGGWFTRYLDEEAPRTHFVRDVAPAFGRWVRAAEAEALASPSPWLPEALSLDLAEHHVGLSAARVDASRLTDFAMDLPAALDPTHQRLRLSWTPEGAPDARALLLFRHPERHSVETLALTPMAADVLDAMDDGATPAAEAVRAVLARYDVVAGSAFVESFAGLLAELMERGVLRGSLR